METPAGTILFQFFLCLFLWPSVRGSFDSQSLDSFLHQRALLKSPSGRRTGRLYHVLLPANFSGMEASVARFRSGSLWRKGANISFFRFPPNILPHPFSKRIDIVFENLGNWSSSYYSVSNHTLVAPVVGFLGYEAGSSYRLTEFRVTKDPILVHFPSISLPDEDNNDMRMKCVWFGINGAVELTNVTLDRLCVARGQGHFSLVIPKKKKGPVWKWWAVGLGVGLVFLVFVAIWMHKVVKEKRVGRMQKQTERSEALGTVWVGRSRMPFASGIRTQPVLEDNYVP